MSTKTLQRAIPAAAVAVCLVASAGCGGNPAAPQGNYGSVLAFVKSTGGQPISGAVVSADSVLTCTTGADGKCTIQTVPVDSPSTHTTVAVVQANGYQTGQSQSVTVTAGKTVEADFSLPPQ